MSENLKQCDRIAGEPSLTLGGGSWLAIKNVRTRRADARPRKAATTAVHSARALVKLRIYNVAAAIRPVLCKPNSNQVPIYFLRLAMYPGHPAFAAAAKF